MSNIYHNYITVQLNNNNYLTQLTIGFKNKDYKLNFKILI